MIIKEFVEKIKRKEIDIVEHTHKTIDESKKINKEYNYFNTISDTQALMLAEKLKQNSQGKLCGVPIAIKDSIVVKDVESTAGSRILKGYMPLFNATSVQNAVDEGAIIIGKTSQDEFGFGAFSTNAGLGFKVPKNPFDKKRATGGSSGGSAGIAQKLSFVLSYGESTGGSIVNPACFCGVYGLCPTYGRVSRYGLIDYGNSLDKVGPMSRNIQDIAFGLEIMSGYDKKDSTSLNSPVDDYSSYINKGAKGLKIGVIKEAFGKGVQKDVEDGVWDGVKRLEDEGAKYEEVSLPLALKYGVSVYYILATSEASTNLAKYCGMRYGKEDKLTGNFNEYFTKVRSENFGNEAKRRIILGTFARMAGYRDAYYLKAASVRTKIIEEYKKAFKKFDVLVSPTVPYIAPTFDEIKKLTPLQNYMADIMTVGPNLAGLPHMNVPIGMASKLPLGMLVIGDHLQEGKIIQAGAVFNEK